MNYDLAQSARLSEMRAMQSLYFNSVNTNSTTEVAPKKGSIVKSFREYLDKHRDLIFTVALVFVADHYLLGGALKDRLRSLLEGILQKAENNVKKELAQ